VLDFGQMRDVQVDAEAKTATASAGTLVGDISKACDAKGFTVGESVTRAASCHYPASSVVFFFTRASWKV